jgi:glucan 1,3-beta-glucosidase
MDEAGANLAWAANLEADVTGYHVYRSVDNNVNYQLLAASIVGLSYTDTTVVDTHIYYYKVAAVDAQDISFDSDEVVSGASIVVLPGLVEAENWTDMSGFSVESTADIGGGHNTGFADPGDWLEYTVNIASAGDYVVEYRLATANGSAGFTLSVGGNVVDTVEVTATGGWQTWETQTNTVTLPAGEHTLRLDAIGNEWNLNWIRFSPSP